MRFQTLQDWLAWQQTLHVKNIALGLERVEQVYARLPIDRVAHKVITIAGTNGKGSSVAYYETWLKNRGYRVASYTSPHLLHYNERVKLNQQAVTDDQLCAAFDLVEQARGDTELTYFEFGTLAALLIISDFRPDFAILEIGLGGRLDAVNIIDPDLAHLTHIGLDHQEWLGSSREQIGFEKAGILRDKGLAICNDHQPPESVISALQRRRCVFLQLGQHYDYAMKTADQILWQGPRTTVAIRLPLAGEHQAQNISGVLAGLELLGCLQDLSADTINSAFSGVSCPGRLQTLESKLNSKLIVDVGHNPDAAVQLSAFLQKKSRQGKVVVLLGMLEDKDSVNFVRTLLDVVDEWWLLNLDVPRGLSASALAQRIEDEVARPHLFESMQAAMDYAMSSLNNQDILLITGSFMTVEAALNSTFVTLE